MKGFVIYPAYSVEQGKSRVHIFGRLENGESFEARVDYNPYFYIKESDIDVAKSLATIKYETTSFTNFDGAPVVKVIVNIPKEVPELRRLFENNNIICYEADIRFAYRCLIDKKIKGSLDIDGDYEKGTYVSRIYNNPSIKPAQFFPELKVLSLDIETSRDAKELYCIGLMCGSYKKTLLISDEEVDGFESFSNEKSLLERFRDVIIKLDPDIITGWNVIDFDFAIIQQKFRKHKIPFKIGRNDWKCELRQESSFIIDSKADFPGRVVLDGIHLLKTSFIKLDNYKLNTASKVFVGEEKLISEHNKGEDIENYFHYNKKALADYNMKDAELVLKILKATAVINLTVQRSLLTGMPLDRVRATIASFDSLYLRRLRERKKVAPCSGRYQTEERIKGGYVMESLPGIYENILVFDFKSLYPSIIRTFNIDPLSFVSGESDDDNLIIAPNGAKFRNDEGLLPLIIRELWSKRDNAKQEGNEAASYAIKILMNSFFGALANPSCRFYSLDIANAITHFGQFLIKKAADEIESIGYKVIYGDTDSCFVNPSTKSYEEAKIIGEKIQKKVNDFFKKFVHEKYNRENFMELEFEKIFIKFFMPTIRHTEVGSKKRYAGTILKDGTEQLVFTGLESVRRDWTELSKRFQRELLHRIFHKDDYTHYIKNLVKDLKKGAYDNLLIYRKALTKPLESYIKTTPPHVKAARLLPELKSNIVEYVMTINGPEPLDMIKSTIDYEHYIKKQLKPIADSILSFFNTSFDDITSSDRQQTLAGF